MSLTRSLSALKASRWTESLVCRQRRSHCRRFLRAPMMSLFIQTKCLVSRSTPTSSGERACLRALQRRVVLVNQLSKGVSRGTNEIRCLDVTVEGSLVDGSDLAVQSHFPSWCWFLSTGWEVDGVIVWQAVRDNSVGDIALRIGEHKIKNVTSYVGWFSHMLIQVESYRWSTSVEWHHLGSPCQSGRWNHPWWWCRVHCLSLSPGNQTAHRRTNLSWDRFPCLVAGATVPQYCRTLLFEVESCLGLLISPDSLYQAWSVKQRYSALSASGSSCVDQLVPWRS